jgi:hypothetical protein
MMLNPDVKKSLLWLVLAALIGFLVPALFSSGLRWERPLFLIPYVAIIGAFLILYFRSVSFSFKQLIAHWPYGLIGVAAATYFLLRNIQGQPVSAIPEGGQLILALLWIGLVYGVVDAFLLNVMPVLAIQGPKFYESGSSWKVRLARGLIALAASVVITVAYHAGYTEFHGPKMLFVIIGNVIITLSYLLTGSPLAPVVTHVIMHVAAVLHGMETTLQLPPHYPQ